MNQVQKLYSEAKAAYKAAMENKDTEVLSVVDSYFKAQDDIVEWALKYNVKMGRWDSDDAAVLRHRMKSEERTLLANSALRYDVTICPKCITEHYGTFTKCENCGHTES